MNMFPFSTKELKRIKTWLTQELIRKMTNRDQLKRDIRFDEYEKQRYFVLNLVEKAIKNYFSRLVQDICNTSSIWKAINSITRNNSKNCDISASNIRPASFNDHFLSLSTRLLQSLTESSGHDSNIFTSSVLDLCREK